MTSLSRPPPESAPQRAWLAPEPEAAAARLAVVAAGLETVMVSNLRRPAQAAPPPGEALHERGLLRPSQAPPARAPLRRLRLIRQRPLPRPLLAARAQY